MIQIRIPLITALLLSRSLASSAGAHCWLRNHFISHSQKKIDWIRKSFIDIIHWSKTPLSPFPLGDFFEVTPSPELSVTKESLFKQIVSRASAEFWVWVVLFLTLKSFCDMRRYKNSFTWKIIDFPFVDFSLEASKKWLEELKTMLFGFWKWNTAAICGDLLISCERKRMATAPRRTIFYNFAVIFCQIHLGVRFRAQERDVTRK